MTEERGKKVTNANGTEPGTDGALVKYMFSGSPQDMFEFAPQAGEVRVMTVVAECTRDTGRRLTHDGKQLVAPWAIREVTLGRQTTLRDDTDPNQTAIDDPDQTDDGDPEPDDETKAAGAEQAAIAAVPDPFTVNEPPQDDGTTED
ncbi:hypothetical protein SEA_LENNON_52 [Gordonia phage Lennon]|uniref:Uncharacterized protein n=3 Tax=Vividuovirus TaxID=2560251 RepID=A0A2U9PFM3_9CAUD|nr:hypothetical protein FDI74_gp52 [Gordonia phage Lennon]YP_009623003.1 hypothetical protein FDJ33_gp54 [Gordonia phage Brandonk123]ATN90246.1 hypothetical protein SEA_LENNON_52 [Gordonia phage Lennon]AUX81891.1 hypothetical protein SEA_BRANDONK123_54 [Gordonia phage Brandonk123]AWT50551.1 hypothetical protein PBI_SITAR_52 [Gordonia phage Sitar]